MSEWTKLPLPLRIKACHYDTMNHADMAMLSGIVTMGEVYVEDDIRNVPGGHPTACTEGLHCWYYGPFIAPLPREELRWVVCHENLHKALKHCTTFAETLEKYPGVAGIAMDYVVNALLLKADPEEKWMRPPSTIKIYRDPKYYGMSYPQVLNDLLRECKKNGGNPGQGDGPGGAGAGKEGVAYDGHLPGKREAEAAEKLEKAVNDALHHGQILSKALKSRGTTGSGGALSVTDMQENRTDWKAHMRDFFCSAVRGSDSARWSRINARVYAATARKVILPTLYAETVGHVGIFADTSGSMAGIYPVLFGAVARIMQDVLPEKVTLIWWDTQVAGVQEFLPEQYSSIKNLLKPAGGGGTTPQCVVDYVKAKRLKFQCVVWLTDGYIGNDSSGVEGIPQLWGVVDNERFVAQRGKTLHISSHV